MFGIFQLRLKICQLASLDRVPAFPLVTFAIDGGNVCWLEGIASSNGFDAV